jgi:hypothetical protein
MTKKNQFVRLAAIYVITGSSLLTGCASIVNGTNQVVSVEARNKGQQVVGATCKLENGKGTYYVTTPGTVTVHRAYDDMNVRCEKESVEPGLATIKSTTKPMAFGNIIFGGVIGAAVDAGSGAAYDYPSLITVLMGAEGFTVPTSVPVEGKRPETTVPSAAVSSNSSVSSVEKSPSPIAQK